MSWANYAAAMGRPGAKSPTDPSYGPGGWQPTASAAVQSFGQGQPSQGQVAYGLRTNPQASQQYSSSTWVTGKGRRGNRRGTRRANRRANRKANTRRRR